MFVFIVYVLKYKNVYTFVGFKTGGMVMLFSIHFECSYLVSDYLQ